MAEEEGGGEDELALGHQGIGDDCLGKVVNYGGKFMVAGGAFGVAEGCFLTPIPGSKTPMVVRSLALSLQRSLLVGSAGAVYAGTVCMAARLRDKDDYFNAVLGGALSGAVFGIRYKHFSLGLGLAATFAVLLGATKYRLDVYFPSLYNIKPKTNTGPRSLLQENDE